MRERTRAGLAAALARGRVRGRCKGLGGAQRRHAVELYRSRQLTVKEICALVGVSRSTLYAYVEEFAEGGGTAASVPASRSTFDATRRRIWFCGPGGPARQGRESEDQADAA